RLRERVEGAGLLSVGQVARVQHERRTRHMHVESRDGVAQRAQRVLVGLAAEADVRVADLSEREVGAGGRRLAEHRRGQHAAARGPHQSGPGPGQALHEVSPFHGILLRRRHFTTTVAVMCGCRAQKYVYVPGVVKRCAYVSLRSSPPDVYARSVAVTVCGSSSPLIHVTVARTGTWTRSTSWRVTSRAARRTPRISCRRPTPAPWPAPRASRPGPTSRRGCSVSSGTPSSASTAGGAPAPR